MNDDTEKIKKFIKKNCNQPGPIFQTYDSGYETKINP
jgi:hypothetical protein